MTTPEPILIARESLKFNDDGMVAVTIEPCPYQPERTVTQMMSAQDIADIFESLKDVTAYWNGTWNGETYDLVKPDYEVPF